MTFGAGFLMRPMGAIVLGAYADRTGRRAGLLLTLGLMSLGTLSIALMPGYARIGLLAPLIVLVGRLLQGFSAGVRAGRSLGLSFGDRDARHKGFYVSWQSASQQVAVDFAALLGVVAEPALPPSRCPRWGWRVPLLVGCAAYSVSVSDPAVAAGNRRFRRAQASSRRPRISASLAANWKIVLIGTLMVTMTTVSFYMITAYTPTFGSTVLHLAAATAWWLRSASACRNFSGCRSWARCPTGSDAGRCCSHARS